jgi:methionine-gamma-lyase
MVTGVFMAIAHFSTAQIHAGGQQLPTGYAGILEDLAGLPGGSPTIDALEKTVAALEEAAGAVATSSGTAAVNAAAFSFLKPGRHMVLSEAFYGSPSAILKQFASYFGVNASVITTSGETAADNTEEFEKSVTSQTGLIFVETPANPTLGVTDIKAAAAAARKVGAMLVVDNSLATSYFQNPLELGADVVTYFNTIYLGGFNEVKMGAAAAKKEKHLEKMRDFVNLNGAAASALDAYLCLQGIKTLSLRMEKHFENAMQVVDFLQLHPKIWKVYHPGVSSFEGADTAQKQMRGYPAIIAFDIKGGYEAGKRLVKEVKLITRSTSLGGIETSIQHPASMLFSQTPIEERLMVGITDELIRLSIGLEDIDNLIEDLDQALIKV